MNKTIKGYSLHADDGTSETHVIKGGIPRATFFEHKGDFEKTVMTSPVPLDEPHRYTVSTPRQSYIAWACLLLAVIAFIVVAFVPR